MAKLIHLVVESCGECPYNIENDCGFSYCNHGEIEEKNSIIHNYKEILQNCPLQTY